MKPTHCRSVVYQVGFIFGILALACCNSNALPRKTAPTAAVVKTAVGGNLESANMGFAFDLLNELANEEPGSNIFISPYSASTALEMAASGAAGVTSAEMQETLGTAGIAPLALYKANKSLLDQLNGGDTNVVLTVANALWYLNGFPIKQGFLNDNAEYFDAKVAGVDFNDPSAADTINAWASEETDGKITKIVSSPMDGGLVMLLANAVYFKGTWQNSFDSTKTSPQPFYLAGGGQETVSMMQQSTNYDYYETPDYQAVRLPYSGSNIAMYVFLPSGSLQDLMQTTSGTWWQETKAQFHPLNGSLSLPKFNLSCSLDLVQPLQNLGIQSAFSKDANFSKISRAPLQITDVKQQAIIEVDEQGTVAAAVTTIGVGATAVGVDSPFYMIVDRPFLLLIEDRNAATILFMGAVFAP
ncbi:MAG TPA: serpin family protein [Verrucomicrobiae bacterium]|jgi:serpin B